MQAFIAILLVAAVSGQFTSGVEKSMWDQIKNRNTIGTYGDRTVYPYGSYGDRSATYQSGTYGKYLQKALAELIGSNYDETRTGSFQYGGLNAPSDVYTPTTYNYLTIGQLYASPIFQQYLTLPLFRQYITYPAFQRYVATGYFQQYYTQAAFQQFFSEPALFYRYIYPIVAQFQTVGSYEPVITVPEVYRQYVPEYVYNYINKINAGVDTIATTVGNRGYFPTTDFYGKQINQEMYNWEKTPFNKYFGNYNFEKTPFNKFFGNYNFEKTPFNKFFGNYNFEKTPAFNKFFGNYNFDKLSNMEQKYPINYILEKLSNMEQKYPVNYNFEKLSNMEQKYPVNYNWEKLSNMEQKYPVNFEGFSGLNMNDVDAIRRVLFPQTFEKTYNYPKNWYNTIVGDKTEFNWENTPATYTPTWALNKIFKDLVEGKVDVNELKNVVNPVTGEVKIVDEKIVKPFDTTILEGELTKDAMHKVMLKKEVFNKL